MIVAKIKIPQFKEVGFNFLVGVEQSTYGNFEKYFSDSARGKV